MSKTSLIDWYSSLLCRAVLVKLYLFGIVKLIHVSVLESVCIYLLVFLDLYFKCGFLLVNLNILHLLSF